MTPTKRLTAHVRSAEAAPVGKLSSVTKGKLAALGKYPSVYGLFAALIEKNTSFVLYDVEIYPQILERTPQKGARENEVCVAKNGAGDLYLFDTKTGKVRFWVHDEDRDAVAGTSFDAFLEDTLHASLEHVEVDGLEGADAAYLANVKVAIAIAGADALDEEAREKLVALGIVGG